MQIKEMLKQKQLGNPQAVGNMVVVPILSETENHSLSTDMAVVITRDEDYERLTLRNDGDKTTVTPVGSMFMTNDKKQDRLIKSAQVFDPSEERQVNVFCVQSGGGDHHDKGVSNLSVAPKTIRQVGYNKRDESEYNAAWPEVEKFTGSSSDLHRFYDLHKKELDEFVMQFENVPKQVGAVVLINGEVVGFEFFGNYGSWGNFWRKYVRDCWGAEARKQIEKKNAKTFRKFIDIDSVTDVASLGVALNQMINQHNLSIMEKVSNFLSKEISFNEETDYNNLQVANVEGHSVVGQAVKDKQTEEPVYCCIFN